MTGTEPTIVQATSNPTQLARVVGLAFADLDIAKWLVPDGARRVRVLSDHLGQLVAHAMEHGRVHTDTARLSVAVWLRAGDNSLVPEMPDYEELRAYICEDDVERFIALEDAVNANHPHVPHWYLALLAVTPTHQGQGLGSALLEYAFRDFAKDGLPAYLEASSQRSRGLYRRHGWQDVAQPLIVGDGAPPMYPMWRAAGGTRP